jgi:hypothetical protein
MNNPSYVGIFRARTTVDTVRARPIAVDQEIKEEGQDI